MNYNNTKLLWIRPLGFPVRSGCFWKLYRRMWYHLWNCTLWCWVLMCIDFPEIVFCEANLWKYFWGHFIVEINKNIYEYMNVAELYIFKIKRKWHGMKNLNLHNISRRQSAGGLHVPVFDFGKHFALGFNKTLTHCRSPASAASYDTLWYRSRGSNSNWDFQLGSIMYSSKPST